MSSPSKATKICTYGPCNRSLAQRYPHKRCSPCRARQSAQKRDRRDQKQQENAISTKENNPTPPPVPSDRVLLPLAPRNVNLESVGEANLNEDAANTVKYKRQKVKDFFLNALSAS